jgi:hypothetical protein
MDRLTLLKIVSEFSSLVLLTGQKSDPIYHKSIRPSYLRRVLLIAQCPSIPNAHSLFQSPPRLGLRHQCRFRLSTTGLRRVDTAHHVRLVRRTSFGSLSQFLEQYTNALGGIRTGKCVFHFFKYPVAPLTYDTQTNTPTIGPISSFPPPPPPPAALINAHNCDACVLPRPLLQPQPSRMSHVSPLTRVPDFPVF